MLSTLPVILLLVANGIRCAEEKKAVRLVSLEECKLDDPQPPKGFEYKFDLKNGVLNGFLHLPFAVDDDLMVNVVTQSLVDGKWMNSDDVEDGSFCEGMDLYYPGIVKFVKARFNLEAFCPIPAGKYEMKEWSIEPEESRLYAPPNFRQRLHMVFSRDDDDMLCLLLELAN